MLEYDAEPASRVGQDVDDSRVHVRQTAFARIFTAIQYNDWPAWRVVPRAHPEPLVPREARICEVIEWLSEVVLRECRRIGRASRQLRRVVELVQPLQVDPLAAGYRGHGIGFNDKHGPQKHEKGGHSV